MNLLITFLLLSLLIILLCKSSKDLVLSPALVFTGSFDLGVGVCIVNPDWLFDISTDTMFLLVGTCFSFSIGHFIFKRISIVSIKRKLTKEKLIFIGNNTMAWFAIFLQFFFLISFALFIIDIGGGFNLLMISNARAWMLYNSIPNSIGICVLMSKAIAMIYVYVVIQDKYLYKKIRIKYIIPILLYIFIEILSTSRSGLIFFFGYFFVLYLLANQTYGYVDIKLRKSSVRAALTICMIVVFTFVMLGNLTGKTEKLGAWNMFATYFGGSIYALDWFVDNIEWFSSPIWGYNSFPIITSLMKMFDIFVPVQDAYYFPFIEIPSITFDSLQRVTNLYTSIGKPLCDFGFAGSMCFFFFLGILYSFVFNFIRCKAITTNVVTPNVIYLGYIMMPVVGSGPQYVFGSLIFSPMALYQLIFISVFAKVLLKKVKAC